MLTVVGLAGTALMSRAGARPPAAGTISGTVTYTGTPPTMKPIDMTKEPACAKAHNPPAMTESVVTGPDNALGWVVVYVSAGDQPGAGAPPPEAVRYDQKNCLYIPHVAVMQVGQELDIYNDDPHSHNIHPLAQINPEWNKSQPKGAPPIHAKWDAAEFIRVKCNVHSWMHGWFVVLNTPHYAVTGADGAFTLKGLPPGTYTLTAWHERFGTETQQVTVGEGATPAVKFVFKALPY